MHAKSNNARIEDDKDRRIAEELGRRRERQTNCERHRMLERVSTDAPQVDRLEQATCKTSFLFASKLLGAPPFGKTAPPTASDEPKRFVLPPIERNIKAVTPRGITLDTLAHPSSGRMESETFKCVRGPDSSVASIRQG